MIIDRARYRAGVRYDCDDLSDALSEAQSAGGFIWLGVKDPSAEELTEVAAELGLHPLAIEDALKGNQRPKIEIYDGYIFAALSPLHYRPVTGHIELGEVMVFIGQHFVVTIRRGTVHPMTKIRERLEQQPAELSTGPATVFYAILDSVVDEYVEIERQVSTHLERMEETIFAGEIAAEERDSGSAKAPGRRGQGGQDARRIYELKREVLLMRRAVIPLVDGVKRLAHQPTPNIPEDTRPFFRDVADHLLRVTDHLESFDRLLSDILSAHLARISVQQNDDMRKISAWVAIAAVPTMIAGIYGMNFDHMPELGWKFGYPLVIGFMASVCLIMYRAFRRDGWL